MNQINDIDIYRSKCRRYGIAQKSNNKVYYFNLQQRYEVGKYHARQHGYNTIHTNIARRGDNGVDVEQETNSRRVLKFDIKEGEILLYPKLIKGLKNINFQWYLSAPPKIALVYHSPIT